MNWTNLAQDRANGKESCERGEEPFGSIKFGDLLTGRGTVSFSRRTFICGVG